MSGTRNVTNITLRQPTSTSAIMILHGHFEMLSLSGSFLPPPAPPAATGVIEAQHSLEESNVPLFHRLPSNLLNSIQLPSEAFWATGGLPPFLLTISINYHYLENSVQLHLQASTIAKRMINKKLDL
ncbi:hypothetical protein Gogos_015721 [Gossypium gossypioides]|uniref:Uncharacterized protein n=1 Tax=Gossypium gossypioides TaxID=34282 RepID=A0A7J9C2T4_GOSGO|nr:hypothetical protein [Gossypium gossypioides]